MNNIIEDEIKSIVSEENLPRLRAIISAIASERIKEWENRPQNMVRVPIPQDLIMTQFDKGYNSSFDMTPQYKLVTLSHFHHDEDVLRAKHLREFYEKHRTASAIVSNQEGEPLYALYGTWASEHNEMVLHLFKTLRAMRLNDWEDEL